MLFADPAFISFEIINTEWFVFSEHRYGAFITQIFPLVAVKLGLSLSAVLILYSVSFYLFYLGVFLICGYVLKQYKFGILLVFYFTLFVSDVFFWPNNEIHQAVGWGMLFMALFKWASKRMWDVSPIIHLLLIALVGLAINSHLLFALPLGFMWVYEHLDDNISKGRMRFWSAAYSLIIVSFMGLRYWLSHDSWYDGNKLEGVQNASFEKIFSCFRSEQAQSIYELMTSVHWIVWPIFILGMFYLISAKRYSIICWTLLSVLGYFVIVTLTHPSAITEANRFYFESQWNSWTIILAYPFVSLFVNHLKKHWLVALLFLAIFISRAPVFTDSLTKFQNRCEVLSELCEQGTIQQSSKLLIRTNPSLEQKLMLSWGLPVESLLWTALKGKMPNTSIKIVPDNFKKITSKDSIYTAFDLVPNNRLNSKYFSVDVINGYYVKAE